MPSITIKEYFAVSGSFYTDADANKIGPVLNELSKEGAVTARDVVDAARSTNSPLRDYFEWDNKVAGDLWRVETARRILRSINVRYLEGKEVHVARAFQIVRTSAYESEPRRYRTFQVLHGDSAFAAQMMDSAFEDLQGWKRKYEPYVEIWTTFGDAFQAVINQISEYEEVFKSEAIAGETDEALIRMLAWREECRDALATWTGAREQMKFIMEAIGSAEKIFSQLNEKKERKCLKCAKPFMSFGAHNRICKSCTNSKKLNETQPGTARLA